SATPPGERSSDQVTEPSRARVAAAKRQASTGQGADDHSQSRAPTVKARVTRNWVRKKLAGVRGLRPGAARAVAAGDRRKRTAVVRRASRRQKSASMVHRPP